MFSGGIPEIGVLEEWTKIGTRKELEIRIIGVDISIIISNDMMESGKLPTPGLVIPQIPVAHSNGTSSPKNKSWKEIIEHWLIDWPREWHQGANRQFASKYHQRATIAPEFINHTTHLLFWFQPIQRLSLGTPNS
ncbi:hypothetical protein BDR07DRAFT_1384838 [Suillus spraguei]|nr:hypothetical protein BDR07DRAFT_1384838 [Suillus spraguei]